MEKKLNKPHTINERIDSPLGLLGVPPDTRPLEHMSREGERC